MKMMDRAIQVNSILTVSSETMVSFASILTQPRVGSPRVTYSDTCGQSSDLRQGMWREEDTAPALMGCTGW